jgi:hypothetical protein
VSEVTMKRMVGGLCVCGMVSSVVERFTWTLGFSADQVPLLINCMDRILSE